MTHKKNLNKMKLALKKVKKDETKQDEDILRSTEPSRDKR